MQSVLAIWRTGDEFIARLNSAADALHAHFDASVTDRYEKSKILNRIFR